MSAPELLVAALAVAVGACAQGSFGFGLGLVAAPVLALVDSAYVPGPLLMVALVLTVLVTHRERAQLEWHGVRWAILGRLPGNVVGAVAVAALPERHLIVLFAVLILVGVGLSVAGWDVRPTPRALFSAGAASGVMGSITSIGGPPMALVYQRRSGSELRSNLALFFLIGTMLSILALTVAGEITRSDVGRAAVLVPPMLLGFGASRVLARRLDGASTRAAVLGFSAAAALVLLARELVGR